MRRLSDIGNAFFHSGTHMERYMIDEELPGKNVEHLVLVLYSVVLYSVKEAPQIANKVCTSYSVIFFL